MKCHLNIHNDNGSFCVAINVRNEVITSPDIQISLKNHVFECTGGPISAYEFLNIYRTPPVTEIVFWTSKKK